MSDDRPRHPSGRPIREPQETKLSIPRDPGMGPFIERLREREAKDLIGFHRVIPDPEDIDWLNPRRRRR